MPYRPGPLLELAVVHAPRPLLSEPSLAIEDAQTTFISEHGDLLTGKAASEDVIPTQDFANEPYTEETRVATFAKEPIG